MAKHRKSNAVKAQKEPDAQPSKPTKRVRKPPMSKEKRERMEKRLNNKRHRALDKLRTSWEDILNKYSSENLETDVVDLETGHVVEDHGHLATLETNGFSQAVWAGPNQRYQKPSVDLHDIMQRDPHVNLEDYSDTDSDDDVGVQEEQSAEDEEEEEKEEEDSCDDLIQGESSHQDQDQEQVPEIMPRFDDEDSDLDADWVEQEEEEEEEQEYIAQPPAPRLPIPKRSKVWKPPPDDPFVDRNNVWNTGLSDLESESDPESEPESESEPEPEPDPIDKYANCGEIGFHCGRIFCFKCL